MRQEHPFLVAGQWRTSQEPVEIRSPYNGEVVGLTYHATPQDVADAIESATDAFAEMRRLPAYRRAEILEKIVQALKARQEEIARLICQEAAKPIRLARAEAARAVLTFTDALEETKRIRGEWLPLDLDAASQGRFALVRRFPLGPVAAITPFNFPVNLVAHKLAPALACGTSIVLKPAPQAPLSTLNLARIAHEAGVPPGAVNALLCPVEAAHQLVA
ncbi:MAG: aldehyde dehydrogenase family protein, partial [Acidobacteria bacterium]|nr:aldehyde dehydrogenase family protein [Acidobacteriota bacterium]